MIKEYIQDVILDKNVTLDGKFVILRPLDENDFNKIIEWRNDPENRQYLNQPFKLTIELQNKWYRETYLKSNELLFVIISKYSSERIGTIGFNDLDIKNHTAIFGRLLIGEKRYRGSKELIEANILLYDHIFYSLKIEKLYGHVIVQNKKVLIFNQKFGFIPTTTTIFPRYCKKNGLDLIEIVNSPEAYANARTKIIKLMTWYFFGIGDNVHNKAEDIV